MTMRSSKNISCAVAIFLVAILISPIANTAICQRSETRLSEGYWPTETSQQIIDRTQFLRMAPDISHLSDGERIAVKKLLEVGNIFQALYETQRHWQASASLVEIQNLDRRLRSPAQTQNLLRLYRLNQGPVATTLENKREPFLPVERTQPGKNVYPWGIKKEEVAAFLTAHPDRRNSILDLRTVVRRATMKDLQRDLAKLRQYQVLDVLHLGLRQELEKMLSHPNPRELYAVPYSVAYADELVRTHALLTEAANAVQNDDEEFARYLRNRSRDLLSNDYESGDAAWVVGRFKNLNAVIGSYETYDDELYGVKSFFGLSVLTVRNDEIGDLRQAMRGLQALEDSLPYTAHKLVRHDIPVTTCDVIADFGQARGGNTATILPNESYLARRYGRTIVLRPTIMWDSQIFQSTKQTWEAAVAPAHKEDLTSEGNVYRTTWHEIGHYLGVDRTKDGRDLDEALQEHASTLEELKGDLVCLYIAEALRKQRYYAAEQLRSLYAGGILRVLQNNRPRRDQPYNTMQLMQWNFYLENGLLSFDPMTARLSIHYEKYHEVVGKMLAMVLSLQYEGDKDAAERFIDRYGTWDDNLHGVVAKNIRAQQRYRFRVFTYAALRE